MKRSVRAAVYLVLTIGLMASCATHPMPAWDVGTPDWRVCEAAAVWRPDSKTPELSGELSLATRADGSRMVQFSKQGVPVVIARAGSTGWEIGSPFRENSRGGRGRPPSGVLWFLLDDLPPSRPVPADWSLTLEGDGRWILENRKRGERLEVVP